MKRSFFSSTSLLFIAALLLLGTACTGGGGSSADSAGVADLFNNRNVNLYSEAPLILVQGNGYLSFNPQGPTAAELLDTDNDGVGDTPINDFQSLANAANNSLDFEVAACIAVAGTTPKQTGYLDTAAWNLGPGDAFLPDKMPATADVAGTNGTQFIQLILPFTVDPTSILNLAQPAANDYLVDPADPLGFDDYGLRIEDQDGAHVPCTVLINGADVQGTNDYPTTFIGWDKLTGININPGKNKTSIVFLAQTATGLLGGANVTDETPFSAWAGVANKIITINLKKIRNGNGKDVKVNGKWVIQEDGSAPDPVKTLSISAFDYVMDGTAPLQVDGLDVVQRQTSFVVEFTKPLVPETVGQSIVFGGSPFNGNSAPLSSSIGFDPVCAQGGNYHDPLGPNIVISSNLVDQNGSHSSLLQGVIPFRCYPLHQNNLCTYIINPLIDLPGSAGLTPSDNKIRLTCQVYLHDANDLTGTSLETLPLSVTPQPPVNMGVSGLFGRQGETFVLSGGGIDSETFTVDAGGRYVNAPVCPNALYYTMGNKGMGVVDLDGNGFTTNAPDFEKIALVTCQRFYNRNGAEGYTPPDNTKSFGARALKEAGNPVPTPPYIGLGVDTPMPGVNEGSTGIDEVVLDSNGSGQLFPDPTGDITFLFVSDVEIGDFLDAIYFDAGNPWANKLFHLSAVNIAAEGNYVNNLIATPPTPNPPPLAVPIGMRATHVVPDEFSILEEGALVITGKEVFTVDLNALGLANPLVRPYSLGAPWTGFVHLNPAAITGSQVDEPFPPNAAPWMGDVSLLFPPVAPAAPVAGMTPNYMNTGPLADSSTLGYGWYYGSRQQIGNFLFVADKTNNVVRVVNSNTMDTITTLPGFNGPDSLAVTVDLNKLYVSNSGKGTVSVYNANPRTDGFLNQIAEIVVGKNPKGVHCQCENEDVFVCNFGSNSISIINPSTNTVRKTISNLLVKPWDMVTGPRQFPGLGYWTGVYHGYISNFGGNNVLIYESGPDGYGGIGFDDILDPVPSTGDSGQVFMPIQAPKGLCFDSAVNAESRYAGGCFVAHSTGAYAAVSRIQFNGQQAPLGPIFLIPNSGSIGGTPGFGKRVFTIVSQWGGVTNPLSGIHASDVTLLDYNRGNWVNSNWGYSLATTNLADLGANPYTYLPINSKHPLKIIQGTVLPTVVPDQLYVSYDYTPMIDVIDPNTSTILKTITGLPSGVGVMKTYFKN